MSIFDEIASDASAAVDDAYGETLRLTPMLKGRYEGSTADAGRAVRDLVGAFFKASRHEHMIDNKIGSDFNRELLVARTYASFETSVFAGVIPKKGDRLTRIEKTGEPDYEIAAIEPSGRTRTKLMLDAVNV